MAPPIDFSGRSTVERAFELARSGEFSTVQDIKRRLRDEGFAGINEHIAGRTIFHQLRAANPNARNNLFPPKPKPSEATS
jgi:hypothetical protein